MQTFEGGKILSNYDNKIVKQSTSGKLFWIIKTNDSWVARVKFFPEMSPKEAKTAKCTTQIQRKAICIFHA